MSAQDSAETNPALDSKDQSDIESRTDDNSGNEEAEKSTEAQVAQQPAYQFPEGGLKAWMTVCGVWCTSVSSYGYINSFGVYETYYLQTYLSDYSPSAVAWIGSIQIFCLLGTAIVSGAITDRFGAMVLIWPFSFLLVVAMMLTSLCREYYQFLLCQGILTGVCCGMIFNPAMTVIGHYFHRKRPMASAFAQTGSPIGGVIFPVILTKILHSSDIGFPWAQRICAFLSLFLLSIAAVAIRPIRLRRTSGFFLWEAFKNPAYSLQVVGIFFVILGLWTPYLYLADYGLKHGMSPALASYLFAMINAGSLIGRVTGGIAAQYLGQFNIVACGSYSGAILLFSWLAIKSTAGIVVLAVLFGASSGIVIALMISTLAYTADHPSKLGVYLGQAVFIVSFAALAGTPITGALIHDNATYTPAIVFSASVIMAGAIIYTFARYAFNKDKLVV